MGMDAEARKCARLHRRPSRRPPGESHPVGVGPDCKRSASIRLPRGCHCTPLNARRLPETRSESAFRRNRAECVYVTEAAHNPEVAASNPAPVLSKALETGPFLWE